MALEAIQSLIIDKIVAAFDGDANKFETFLVRASLETDRLAIESAIRKAQETKGIEVDEANAIILGLQEQMQTLIAEIDALL